MNGQFIIYKNNLTRFIFNTKFITVDAINSCGHESDFKYTKAYIEAPSKYGNKLLLL